MKKMMLAVFLMAFGLVLQAQEFKSLDFSRNGSLTNGVKIKTNLPFTNGSHMPTVILEGYSYGTTQSIGIMINWYITNNNFVRYTATSYGGYSPEIKLAKENNKVVIYINDQPYFIRFQVRTYGKGLPNDIEADYTGWTWADEPLTGSNIVTVPYNAINNDGWLNNGEESVYNDKNVGIGTTTPDEKLSVNGKIHTKEVKVDLTGWSDFVFYEDYKLPTLREVESHINSKGHLKDIPSAKDVEDNGILLGEMDAKLLQKIEELTLYTIAQQKEIERLKEKNKELKTLSKRLEKVEALLEK